MNVEWQAAQDTNGLATREFRLSGDGKRDITGALWLPEKQKGNTLVCFGHGASGDRYQTPIPGLARRFSQEAGLPVLSLDGPVHGLRQQGKGGRDAFFPEFQRENCVTDMTADWEAAIALVGQQDGVSFRNLAYFGLSMGSIFGIPLLGSRQDVVVATLGLIGVSSGFPHDDEIIDSAKNIDCPVLFLMQLEDELFTREGYLAVFDAFASQDKRIHANPGLHPEVPAEELAYAFEFMTGHIDGTRKPREVNPFAQ